MPAHRTNNGLSRRRLFQSAAAAGLAACSPNTPTDQKPNVVLLVTDDQGYGDLGCHGNSVIRTPNLDRLHAESVRFTDFHVDPLCAPTRAALLTGRYAYRAGVTAAFGGRSILRRGETTLADIFRANGYRSGLFGKWHLGDNYPYRPNERGFDEAVVCWSGGATQAADAWGNDYFDDTYSRNNVPEKFEGYCTDVFFREGLAFVERNRDNPFFLFLPLNAPHAPYFVDERYSKPYRERGLSETMAAFYGMIGNIDDNVGAFRARLDELGLAENTIFIFMTDNGTAAGYGPATQGGNWAGVNAGMRGRKGSHYDGGHRVPFFIRWPAAGIGGGKDIDRLIAHIDFVPTLIDLLGLELPREIRFDGVSLAPLLRDEPGFPEDRVHFVQHQQFRVGRKMQMDKPQPWLHSSVLTEQWRLIDGKELYDIEADPGQQHDLAAGHPDEVERLRQAYEGWWSEVSGPATNYERIVVGSDEENPTRLTSFDWRPDGGPPNQAVMQLPSAERNRWASNGFWALEVEGPGRYSIKLRERPPEAQYPIEGVKARVRIADFSAEKPIPAGAEEIRFEADLPAGSHDLQTWFDQKDGTSRGAYFVYLQLLQA